MNILLANVAATLFMVGLIWMAQVVHYPLFDAVGEQNYVRYQQRHQANLSYIVGVDHVGRTRDGDPASLVSNGRNRQAARLCGYRFGCRSLVVDGVHSSPLPRKTRSGI